MTAGVTWSPTAAPAIDRALRAGEAVCFTIFMGIFALARPSSTWRGPSRWRGRLLHHLHGDLRAGGAVCFTIFMGIFALAEGDTRRHSSVPPLVGAGMAQRSDAGGFHRHTAAAALRMMAPLIVAQCDASPDGLFPGSGKGKGTGSPGTSSGTALCPGGGKGKGTGTSFEGQGHGPGLVVDYTNAMEFKRIADAAWDHWPPGTWDVGGFCRWALDPSNEAVEAWQEATHGSMKTGEEWQAPLVELETSAR